MLCHAFIYTYHTSQIVRRDDELKLNNEKLKSLINLTKWTNRNQTHSKTNVISIQTDIFNVDLYVFSKELEKRSNVNANKKKNKEFTLFEFVG